MSKYINKNGEVTTKEELIKEVISLLNQFPNHTSVINPNILDILPSQELESIRDNLLKNIGNEIENNKQWLYNLSDIK